MSTSSLEKCVLCGESLLLLTPAEEEEGAGPSTQTILDDVELHPCGHHTHWTCIIDHAVEAGIPCQSCPHCGGNVLNPSGEFLVTVRNEGGITENFDLGAAIAEESDVEGARTTAFFDLLQVGAYDEVEAMLKGEDEGGDGTPLDPNVGYEGSETTALHYATSQNNVEVIKFLVAHGADVNRRDGSGQTPVDIATSFGLQDALRALVGLGAK